MCENKKQVTHTLKPLKGYNTGIFMFNYHVMKEFRKWSYFSEWWYKRIIWPEYSVGLSLPKILWGSLRNLSFETWVLFGSLSGVFHEGKGEQSPACHGIFLPFFHSLKPCAVAFLTVYYWQRKCWFMGLGYRKPCFLVKKQAGCCCQQILLPVSATCPSPGPAPRPPEKG